MAQLAGVLNTSHGPFTNVPAEQWDKIRDSRPKFRDDVPVEDAEEQRAKATRSRNALEFLGQQLRTMQPDVLVVVGDDQYECFDFSNFPALWVFAGAEFAGRDAASSDATSFRTVAGHPALAQHLLKTLLANDFDPAFALSLPKPENGMCHAVMRPLEYWDAFELPVVPVLVNGYFPPQLPASRCWAIGRTIRQAIDSYPEDLRVVVVGSGGLWHTPGAPGAWIDEAFDRRCLQLLVKGDISALAAYFDSYVVPYDDASQRIDADVPGMTGMGAISGPQKGTREICNWIVASATADGRPNVVVDYIPMYSSPIGTAFSFCDSV